MRLPRFEYIAPRSLGEALKLLSAKEEGTYLMAGGTDLVVKMNHGMARPKKIIALKEIPDLDQISFDPNKGLTIGATALLSHICSHPLIKEKFPALAYAPSQMANVQIRNMGTLAGNLCNASPSADNAPTLMAMGAEVLLKSADGERRMALEEFFVGPGRSAMAPEEIMTAIFVPIPSPRSGASYQRISARGKVDMAAVCVGVMVALEGQTCKETKIVLGAVAPVPMRAKRAEALLQGKELTQDLLVSAGDLASDEARPISDVRASSEYRKKMVSILTRRALEEAHEIAAKS
jgi:CO/xanthine dehydrogenase FAD-binding subunit